MKVLSYNLHKGRAARGGRPILVEAVDAIRERAPDLLLCQEVFHGRLEFVSQAERLAAELGMEHVYGPTRFWSRGCHGNATFTRLHVVNATNVDLTESFLERRGVLHVRLETVNGGVEVLNTHLSLTHGQRRRQWRKLCEALPVDAELPVVVAGDFNDWHGRLDRRVRKSRSLRNALRALPLLDRLTYPAHRPLFPLDRVYYRGFALRRAEVLRGDPWARLSDHLPVEVELATGEGR